MRARKILAASAMAASAVLLLVLLAAVPGIWVLRGQVLQWSARIAAVGDQALERGQGIITQADTLSGRAQSRLTQGVTEIEAAGARAEEARILLLIAEQLLDRDLTPAVDQIWQHAANLRDAVLLVDSALSLLQRLPFIDTDNRLLTAADAVVSQAMHVIQRVEETRAAILDAKSRVIQNLVGGLTTPLNRVNSTLQALSESMQQLEGRMAEAQAQLQVLLAQIHTAATWTAVFLTVFLLWLGLSQVALFLHAYRAFTGRDLLARWYTLASTPLTPGDGHH